MIERFQFLFNELALIFSKDRVIKKPFMLFKDYMRFRFKMSRLSFGENNQYESFFHFKVYFPNYTLFHQLWKEIFLKEAYVFEKIDATPRIIDVGSNFGMSVFFFKYLYPNSTIIAFEPTPAIFELLKKNVEENGLQNVEVINEALVGESGIRHVDIFVDPSGQDSTTNSIIKNSSHGGTHTRTISVKAATLSNYLKGEAVCDILKMDIEGAEFGVMEEIEPYLNKVKFINIEIHQKPGAENDPIDKILAILHRNNFRYFIANCDYGTYRGYFKAYNIMVQAVNLRVQ